jgi:uncharacterized YigZ family protein
MSEPRYLIPAETHRVEHEIERSRFITTLARAATADEARAFIARVRGEFPDATHHCWAYVVGPPGSTACIGMSDDGEPHGTAGRPMLNAMLHGRVGDVAAVVTRYFGGTLLGKGGLVRAYTGGVVDALATLPTVERVRRSRVAVELEYAHVDVARRTLPTFDAAIVGEEFSATVGYRVELPTAKVDSLRRALLDATAGDVLFDVIDDDP